MKNDFLSKLKGFVFFYRWHPEVAIRYLPIVKKIRKFGKYVKLLEVGSGGLGIAPYLKKEVIGLDIKHQKPIHPDLRPVLGNAKNLPFDDNSFDVLIMVDTLEHIKKKDREKVISELIRVGRRLVVLAFPEGKKSRQEDSYLYKYGRKKGIKDLNFLKEHLEEPLPERKEIIAKIRKSLIKYEKKAKIIVEGNENLFLHRFLMKGHMSSNKVLDLFFRKVFLFFLPIVKRLNKPPFYRKIVYIEIL